MTKSTAVVVDNWLYIDEGELYAIQNGNPTFFYREYDLSLQEASAPYAVTRGPWFLSKARTIFVLHRVFFSGVFESIETV